MFKMQKKQQKKWWKISLKKKWIIIIEQKMKSFLRVVMRFLSFPFSILLRNKLSDTYQSKYIQSNTNENEKKNNLFVPI